MAKNKDTFLQNLQRRPEFTVTFKRGGAVRLAHEGARFNGDHQTLRILDVFHRPIQLGTAMDTLSSLAPSLAAFTDLADQVFALIDLGFLVDENSMTDTLALASDAGAFESLPVHIRMLDDTARTLAFQNAIRRTVKPGDVVLDIGTGSGILAATAALAGARHVYAIERTGIASLAQEVFDKNGLSDRVTLLRGSSLQIELPEKANVLVCELLGNDPLQEDVRRTTNDAVARLLTPDARLLPERVRVLGLPVTVPEDFLRDTCVSAEMAEAWKQLYAVDLSPLHNASKAQDHKLNATTFFAREWPRVCDAVSLVDLDLRERSNADIDVTHSVTVKQDGTLSGILVYFELLLAGERFSIAPDDALESNHWSSLIWTPGEPTQVRAGCALTLTYRYRNGRSSFELGRGR
jgi:type I protein arginine methyltransferase